VLQALHPQNPEGGGSRKAKVGLKMFFRIQAVLATAWSPEIAGSGSIVFLPTQARLRL